MFAAPEQFAEVNQSNLSAALKFAQVTFDATERLLGLQLAVARDVTSEGAKNAKVLTEVKDIQDFTVLRGKLVETGAEKWADYSKAVYDVAQQTQAQWSKLFEAQITEVNKNVATALDKAVKSAPAGADVVISAFKSSLAATSAAVDSVTKAAKQVASYTDANIKAAASATNAAVKSSKK